MVHYTGPPAGSYTYKCLGRGTFLLFSTTSLLLSCKHLANVSVKVKLFLCLSTMPGRCGGKTQCILDLSVNMEVEIQSDVVAPLLGNPLLMLIQIHIFVT